MVGAVTLKDQEVFIPGLRVPYGSVGTVGTVTLKGQEVFIPSRGVPYWRWTIQ